MALAAGTRLGPYEILAPIGAGGMGEVYRAKDTKLGRDVALKVLPPAFVGDADRLARFRREAQVLASLNHPHIASIYGLEESDGIQALVIELVEGPTLADRISQGPIPLEESMRIARQIAAALEYAHEKSIVHRDLKPANVKIAAEGVVKVLDFGLAKVLDDGRISADPASSPTLTMGATQAGVILGTAAFMAPEQARGQAVDRRADIWAFGVLLFEMLAGRPAFQGESVSDILASVLKFEPDWSALPAGTPGPIRKVLQRCLTKDRKQRLQAIGEARIALEEYTAGRAEVEMAPPVRHRMLPWIAAVVFGLAFVIITAVHFRETQSDSRVFRFVIEPPEKTSFGSLAISPDGRLLAFTATDSDGKVQLWVRPLDSLNTKPLPGTDGATFPFWSPDSHYVAFFASRQLKKIPVSGGPAITICDVRNGRGGAWNRNGTIIFGAYPSPLFSVAAAGGQAKPLTSLDQSKQETSHRSPFFLPDGLHYLYSIGGLDAGIYLGELGSAARTRLLSEPSNAVYAASATGGHLLFWRGGSLIAQPFDAGSLRLSGDPFSVAERVGYATAYGIAVFSSSENGILAYSNGTADQFSQLTWFDRTGKRLGTTGEPGYLDAPSLSPDEKQVAVSRYDPQRPGYDIWLTQTATANFTRFTFGPKSNQYAVWSPDNSFLAFSSDRDANVFNLYRRTSNGAGKDELLMKSDHIKYPDDWSADGRWLLFEENDPKTRKDLWVLQVPGDNKPVSYLRGDSNEADASFSPDGKWVAYNSDESGQYEVYVQSFPASGGKWQISSDGGRFPKWRRNGRELFYVSSEKKITAVDVNAAGTIFQAGTPHPLFEAHSNHVQVMYSVSRDGQRFLISTAIGGVDSTAATVVTNWTAGTR
jgi:serine/threonine protein kinase